MNNLEDFYCISLNHKKLSLNEREEVVKKHYKKSIIKLWEEGQIEGFVSLLTCLRYEFYIHCKRENIGKVMALLEDYQDVVSLYKGKEAVEYLYRVTCGFESIIQGEDEILSQVKKAFEQGRENYYTSKLINVLMNKAIALGKKIRTVSTIAHNTQSLQATVVKMLKDKYGKGFKDKRVLIIGMGELAEKIMELLIDQVSQITICNRTADKITPLLNKHHIIGIHYKNKNSFVPQNDIIICATSAPHPILFFDELKERLVDDVDRVFVDLAVPRDIEEKCSELPGVECLDLDQCWDAYNACNEERENYEKRYSFLLEEQMRKTMDWVYYKNKQA